MRSTLALAMLAAVIGAFSLVSSGQASGVEVLAVEAGGRHTCIIVNDGEVMCWGQNDAGQLGNGATEGSDTPVETLLSGVSAISAGEHHTCALSGDTVLCWGEHDGRLGIANPDGEPSLSPEPVCADEVCTAPLTGVAAISAGGAHTCALMDGGGVQCWGENEDGQLGDGTMTDSPTPVDVLGLPDAVAIAAGGSHTCAVTVDGAAYCWGSNGEGQIGDGRACGMRCPSPSPVAGLGSDAVAITSAGLHSCALTASGAVRCWGLNFDGQVGDGTEDNIRIESTPVSGLSSGVIAISADGRFRGHTCALLASGGVRCWGDNDDGQLGDGTTSDRLVPVAVPGLSDVAALATGESHTCALGDADDLRCWGDNGSGQLGDGTASDRLTPVLVAGLGKAVTGDASCDGVVNSIDAALVLQSTAGLLDDVPCADAADANRDGAISAIDAALILQVSAGLLGQLPA